MHEWQRYQARERRRVILWRVLGCVGMVASAAIMVLVFWLAFLGMAVVFGGVQ